MKKLYTLVMLMTVAVMSFTAAGKSFTIQIDNPEAAYLIDIQASLPYTWSGNTLDFTNVEDNIFFPTNASQGYVITGVTDLSNGSTPTSGSFPTEYCQINGADIADGATVMITTAVRETPVLTITAANPSLLSVNYNYMSYWLENGCFTVPLTTRYASVQISSSNPEYVVTGATDNFGKTYMAYSGCVSIYANDVTSSCTITVEVQNLAAGRTATMTVNVSGNPSAVKLRNTSTYQEVDLNGETTEVKFNPASEASFCVESSIYNKSLYKVELNGERVQPSGSSYYFTATDGCILNVETEFPDVSVPVSFTFGEGVGSDIIDNVSVNGENIFNWGSEDFSVKMGQTVYIAYNTKTYNDISVMHNGNRVNVYSYSPFYQFTVTDETPIEIYSTGEKPEPYHVAVITDCPEGIRVYNGYGYDETERLELSGEETILEIPKTYSYLTFKGTSGYRIESVMDEVGNEMNIGYSNYITQDMTIFVSATEVVRDRVATVYFEPGSWSYRYIALSQGDSDLQVQYTDGLSNGYNFIPFGDFDLPFNMSAYPEPEIYVNNEAKVLEYGALKEDLQDGDVIKLFLTTPSSYSVTYDISEDASVEVRHDHTMLIASPSNHSVFHGTEIVISPVEAESPLARVASEKEGLPIVKADGEICQPNADGKYVIEITKDTAISVEPGETVGIDSIEAGVSDGEAPVYNLQGILVGKAADLRNLPAGTYITGGMKIRK